jgi:glucosyl-dolichyl phosphate glucuronosyltransferase
MKSCSIIICTYNRASFLKQTIDSVLESECRNFNYEIVIIDNNSTDSTSEIVREYKDISFVRSYKEARQGLSNARNRGIVEAMGDFLIFLDDDVEVENGWLEALMNPLLEKPDVAVVGGRVLPFGTKTPEWLPEKFYWLVGIIDYGTTPKYTDYAPGGNMAVRKSIFKEVGVFNPSLGRNGSLLLGGEEVELQGRIKEKGYKIFYAPEALIYHKIANKLNMDYVLRFAYLEGLSCKRIDRTFFKTKYILKSTFGILMAYMVLPLRAMTGSYPQIAIRRKYFKGYLAGKQK